VKRIIEKHSVVALALILLCASFASAGVTQYAISFTNQTAIIAPTPITPLLSADTSMLVLGTVSNFAQVYIGYTDDQNRTHALPLGIGETQWAIRVGRGTQPVIESFDPSSTPYNAYVEVLALTATVGDDQQGGMSLPIKRAQYIYGATTETLLTPAAEETILVTAEISGGADNVTVGWVDSDGPHSQRVVSNIPLSNVAAGNGSPILIHALAGQPITLKTGSGGYWLSIRGIRFGTPAPGPGPFTATVADLDQATAVSFPNATTVLTVPASAEALVVGVQTAASYACVEGTGTGSYSFRDYVDGSMLTAIYSGGLGQFAQSVHLEASTGVRFLTNTFSDTPGCTPPAGADYSVTMAVLQF
jgi:hypothetical protein